MLGEAAFEAVAFARESMVIGRDPQCDHPVNHPMVSWHHAKLLAHAEGLRSKISARSTAPSSTACGSRGRVRIVPGQEIGLGSVRFQLLRERRARSGATIRATSRSRRSTSP